VRQGLREMADGDFDAAQQSLEVAAAAYRRADERIDSPLTAPAALVPVVAQHRTAAAELVAAATTSTTDVARIVDELDEDGLSLVGGRVDLDVVADLERALTDIVVELETLDAVVEEVEDPWLVEQVTEMLDDVRADIDENRSRSDDAIDALRRLPDFLGASEPRRYLMVFTTPAEARGLGGFPGNYAEITADDGQITVTRFGRVDEIDDAAPAGARRLDGPTDWVRTYGAFGFDNHDGGTVGPDPFKNVTMSPSMASTGDVIAQLYAQSGRGELDGVFAADVFVLAELLRFTGPIQLDEVNRRLDAWNAADFLLNEQYAVTDKGERVDLLEDASNQVIETLLSGTRIPPAELFRTMGPMVEQGRLVAAAARDDEQGFLERVGAGGTLLTPDADDALAVTFNNAAASKIDYFMHNAVAYSAAVDGADATITGELRVTMENRAPTEGQPRYVVGNQIGEPTGTNRTYVSVYSKLPIVSMTVDGATVDPWTGREAGYSVASAFVVVAPGETVSLTVETAGGFDPTDGYSLLMRSPPTATPTPVDIAVDVSDATGRSTSLEATMDEPGVERFEVQVGAPA
jgi:hypothetical protein